MSPLAVFHHVAATVTGVPEPTPLPEVTARRVMPPGWECTEVGAICTDAINNKENERG